MPEERRIDGVAKMLPGNVIVVKERFPTLPKRNAVKSTRPCFPAGVPARRDHAQKAGLVSKLFLDPVAIAATEPKESWSGRSVRLEIPSGPR